MIDKLLASVLDVAGSAVAQGATAFVKAVVEHLKKHGTKYLIGGGAAALVVQPMQWVSPLVIQKEKRKVLQNKPPLMKRKSKICIRIMRMIVSAGMKKDRLMKIC